MHRPLEREAGAEAEQRPAAAAPLLLLVPAEARARPSRRDLAHARRHGRRRRRRRPCRGITLPQQRTLVRRAEHSREERGGVRLKDRVEHTRLQQRMAAAAAAAAARQAPVKRKV